LAFTRCSFTSRLFCTNQLSFHSPRPPASPTLVQYHCATIGQYTTPPPTSCLYAIHHTILVITISCKGHDTSQDNLDSLYGYDVIQNTEYGIYVHPGLTRCGGVSATRYLDSYYRVNPLRRRIGHEVLGLILCIRNHTEHIIQNTDAPRMFPNCMG